MQANLPQMYMHALLGPATAGWQMPFLQFTRDLLSENRKEFDIGVFEVFRRLNESKEPPGQILGQDQIVQLITLQVYLQF